MNTNENFKEEAVDPKYMSLYADVDYLKHQLAQICTEIIANNISKYPIFVAHDIPIDLGKQLFSVKKDQINHSISITILEDLVNKKIVALEKVDEFRRVYKDPKQFFCFLVAFDEEPQFIFIKRGR